MSKLRSISTTLPIVEKKFTIPNDCTLMVKITLRPKNWLWKLASFTKIIVPEVIFVEIETVSESVIVDVILKKEGYLYSYIGYARAKEGSAFIRILFNSEKMNKRWKLHGAILKELEN